MNFIEEFQKRAAAAGLTDEQVNSFVNENLQSNEKIAEASTTFVVDQLLDAANVEKSAEARAYVEGFLGNALEQGLAPNTAVEYTKLAVAKVFPQVVTKEAAAERELQSIYFSGMFEKAAELGFTQEQTTEFLKAAMEGAPTVPQAAPAPAAPAAPAAPTADPLAQLQQILAAHPELAAALAQQQPAAAGANPMFKQPVA